MCPLRVKVCDSRELLLAVSLSSAVRNHTARPQSRVMDVTRVGGEALVWKNMAALGKVGEKWQSVVSEHRVFSELRHKNKDGAASRHSAAQLKNLMCSLDGDLLVWNSEHKCFHIISLISLGADSPPENEQVSAYPSCVTLLSLVCTSSLWYVPQR